MVGGGGQDTTRPSEPGAPLAAAAPEPSPAERARARLNPAERGAPAATAGAPGFESETWTEDRNLSSVDQSSLASSFQPPSAKESRIQLIVLAPYAT